jgi:hypothetical protein
MSKSTNTQSVKTATNVALAHLENGDPVEATSVIGMLLARHDIDLDTRKLLEKAQEQALLGTVNIAEAYLGMVVNPPIEQDAELVGDLRDATHKGTVMFNNEVRDTHIAVAQSVFFMLGFVACAVLVVVGKAAGLL